MPPTPAETGTAAHDVLERVPVQLVHAGTQRLVREMSMNCDRGWPRAERREYGDRGGGADVGMMLAAWHDQWSFRRPILGHRAG